MVMVLEEVKRDINGLEFTYENKDELVFGTSFEDSPDYKESHNLNTTGVVHRFLKKRELDKRANDALREWAMTREEAFNMVMG